MKKIFVVLLIISILEVCPFSVDAVCSCCQQEIKVYVDGQEIDFPDQKPFINNDSRTMVPVRFVSEALDAQVEWKEEERRVDVSHRGKMIKLTVGQKQAQVDNRTVILDTQADVFNNRTLVPLRFVSECLGVQVDWDGYMRAVYITTIDKPISQFTGTPMNGETIKTRSGTPIFGSNEPGAQYMYVTVDELPIKAGEHTFYCLEIQEKTISVKQASSNRVEAQLLIIQDGEVIGSRTAQNALIANPFIANYYIQNQCDIALGYPKIELIKVNAFAFNSYDPITGARSLLLVKNPLYKGEWRP